jgi:membrane-associated PAP2 superfamily phosphatase
VGLPLLVLVGGALLFELTDLDLAASRLFYDASGQRWMGKDAWWANELLHTGGKWLIVVLASGALFAFALSFRYRGIAKWRSAALYLALCIGLGTGLVAAAKEVTDRHCPRAMDVFGGSVPYTRLFEGTPAGHPRGRCFPAGHASGAFSLVGLYFVARARRSPRAGWWLAPAALFGAAFAFTQQARGAHFLSHNLWAAGICWYAALALSIGFGRKLSGVSESPAAVQNAWELENEKSQPRRPRQSGRRA